MIASPHVTAARTKETVTAGPAKFAAALRADREDAGADRDRDAHEREVPRAERALQLASGFIGVRHGLLDRFGPEEVHRKVHDLGDLLETDLSIVVSIHWTARFVPHGETQKRAVQVRPPHSPPAAFPAAGSDRPIHQRGPDQEALALGCFHRESAPRPGTTSTVRWVWLQ